MSMKLRKLNPGCGKVDCPTVYLSDRGTFVFQGNLVTDADGLKLGPGEHAVELPREVVVQVFPELSGGV